MQDQTREAEESNDSFFIGIVNTQGKAKEWTTSLNMCNKDVTFKIDTGAKCNVISYTTYDQLDKPHLEKSRMRLVGFGGQKLKTIGKLSLFAWK